MVVHCMCICIDLVCIKAPYMFLKYSSQKPLIQGMGHGNRKRWHSFHEFFRYKRRKHFSLPAWTWYLPTIFFTNCLTFLVPYTLLLCHNVCLWVQQYTIKRKRDNLRRQPKVPGRRDATLFYTNAFVCWCIYLIHDTIFHHTPGVVIYVFSL